jgi:hypothetical protein
MTIETKVLSIRFPRVERHRQLRVMKSGAGTQEGQVCASLAGER